jgi:hypothetical protein
LKSVAPHFVGQNPDDDDDEHFQSFFFDYILSSIELHLFCFTPQAKEEFIYITTTTMPRHQHHRRNYFVVVVTAALFAICVSCWSTSTSTSTNRQIVVVALAMTAPGGSQLQQHKQRTVLVTGGAGYIGSHTCLELLKIPNNLYRVVVVDNLDNSSEESLNRVRELVTEYEGSPCDPNRIEFRNCDIRDKEKLNQGKNIYIYIYI